MAQILQIATIWHNIYTAYMPIIEHYFLKIFLKIVH